MSKTLEAIGRLPAGVWSGRWSAGTKLVLFLALLPVACVAGAAPLAARPADRIVASLGPREVILASGRYGLKYFPDECLAFLQSGPPVRLLMAAGVSTFLLEGRDMRSLVPRGPVLRPGKPGAFDNGYAGISGAAGDPASGALFGFYHAEDHEGMPPIPGGIAGFYCCIAAAVSRDGGASFEKLGPVITSSRPKDVQGRADQGCGDLWPLPRPTSAICTCTTPTIRTSTTAACRFAWPAARLRSWEERTAGENITAGPSPSRGWAGWRRPWCRPPRSAAMRCFRRSRSCGNCAAT